MKNRSRDGGKGGKIFEGGRPQSLYMGVYKMQYYCGYVLKRNILKTRA